MKYFNLVLFAAMMLSTAAVHGQTLPSHDDSEEIACKEAHAKMRSFFMPNRSNPLTENYDLNYYRFEWQIVPALNSIRGKASPYFKVLENGFAEINFDFTTVLNIGSIVYHGLKLEGIKSGTYVLIVP